MQAQVWKLFKDARSIKPEDSEVLYGLGLSLMKLQCFASAAQYFAQVTFVYHAVQMAQKPRIA
jgi:hypothetical protein